ncbi:MULTISPECIES: HNH endonuclease family protein [unclassified Rhodococcus (in: high G+C Gram-positive bacteria)]|nr:MULTISPECIES: HNH endonuclease family protein [unclassified Rhodococcus (in: high G+C Gram-positive bacteria)]NMD96871.1 HNH endonuclease [Rhodococcus sp. BL-253-APC-6A1W]NME77987.1 HNH endonuclease [Rhodococcus sp. 105337]
MARTGQPSIPRWLWILCFIAVSIAVVVLEPVVTDESGAAEPPVGIATGGDPTAVLAALSALPVRAADPQDGYSRELFGPAWTDNVTVGFGRNGCDTRNDILKRDLVDISLEPATKDCTVRTGTLRDTYTNLEIFFRRGTDTSSAVQIDHIVALSDAWKKGARHLDDQARRNLANDPRNLQAVDGRTNQSKGDSDASAWLPPNAGYHCDYVARQVEVKVEYRLWVTPEERDAMARVLSAC